MSQEDQDRGLPDCVVVSLKHNIELPDMANPSPAGATAFSSLVLGEVGESHTHDSGRCPPTNVPIEYDASGKMKPYVPKVVVFEEPLREEDDGNLIKAQIRALVRLGELYRIRKVQHKHLEIEAQEHPSLLSLDFKGDESAVLIEARQNPYAGDVGHYAEFAIQEKLRLVTSLIHSRNVIPTKIFPPMEVTLGMPIRVSPPDWVRHLIYQADDHFGYGGEALREFDGSFISGSEAGIVKSMNQMINPMMSVLVPAKTLTVGMLRILARMGFDPDHTVEPEEMTIFKLSQVSLPMQKKGGIDTGEKWTEQGGPLNYVIKYGGHSMSKEALEPSVNYSLRGYWDRLNEMIDAGVNIDMDHFVTFYYKLATKLEYRAPEDRPQPGEPEKFRTFMIPQAEKVKADKWLSAPFFDWCKGRYTNAIGTNWRSGGAYYFARHMHALGCKHKTKRHRWIHYDCSKYDHSLKAPILTIIGFLALLAFRRSSDPKLYRLYVLSALLLAASISNSTAHVCSWVGEWRTIIGQLFSGEFDTANWNTFYHALVWECYLLWEANGGDDKAPRPNVPATWDSDPPEGGGFRVPTEDPKLLLDEGCCVAKFQGDDGVVGVPYDSIVCIRRMRYYYSKYWGITIKAGPKTEENDYYFSKVDLKTGKIVREGVVFLQRRFVWMREGMDQMLMPFRPIKDYWGRSGRGTNIPPTQDSAKDQLELFAYYRMRWVGLLHDTMETNPAAAKYIRYLLSVLDKNHPQVEHYLRMALQEDKFLQKRWVQELQEYLLKTGPKLFGMDWVAVPPSREIFNHYTLNEEALRVREMRTADPFFTQSVASRH